MNLRLSFDFFQRDALEVAPDLLGKKIYRKFENGLIQQFTISEVEAYNGITDLACHASKGKTARTEIMFGKGGYIYVYLIYGMYWMLNIVVGKANDASAILIRGVSGISGPGRVGRALELDKTFYGENLFESKRIWIENSEQKVNIKTTPRIGIDYAGEPWKSKPWRYVLIS